MDEAVACIPARRLGHHDMRALRSFDGIERGIGLPVLEFFEQPEAEASSDHGGRGEYAASIFPQAFQPSAQDQANALGNL